jgi:aryl-alcohol dehydrogenase-like predicted oxidoreductase
MVETRLVLGAMMFGTRLSDADSFRLLDHFVANGGTWIDTANCYSFWMDESGAGGQSEAAVGRWLTARPGSRERVRIATKVGAQPLVAGEWPSSAEGLAPETIHIAVNESLRRLRTDHVDLLWAHKEDRTTAIEMTAETMGSLVREGLAGRVGASNHPVWRIERARAHARSVGLPGFDSMQLRESYLHPRPDAPVPGEDHPHGLLTAEGRDYALDASLEVWAYTALLGGSYDRRDRPLPEVYNHQGTQARLRALGAVANDLGVARSQVVLSWLVGGKPRIWPILGGSTIDQLDSALAGVRLELSAEHRSLLDDAG